MRPTILLVDNGSSRASATRDLRRLASALTERVGVTVHPVSLLHADRTPAAELDGVPADTFAPFLARRLAGGDRDFFVIPLFFGQSRALTHYIPECVKDAENEHGAFRLRAAPTLCPLPDGEPRLLRILLDNIERAARETGCPPKRVLLVDHGSPIPEVNAVRRWLAAGLRRALGPGARVDEAVMERRPGPAYDFNGERLDEALARLACEDRSAPIFLSLLFLSAGRHAGPGGDIDGMRRTAERTQSGLRIVTTELVGQHPLLIDLLADRIRVDAEFSSAPEPNQDSVKTGSTSPPAVCR
ncbi:CbiX/SirB N-terminal domain-containing protein [Thioalkalicoccus limnaeus]|uniref:CbiX/SirB N-terminal domain-containing protein n=1 Tax=Thioalkalicoccus limnaeus TaxID=120681 RepID=A0ABV4BHA8_9GAMM